MTRSSRHKSSKHSSRDARDYSDSDKDSSLKDRKARDGARVSKDLGSGEKRKQKYGSDARDSKDFVDSGNGEECRASKRRKDRTLDEDDGDAAAERWNGGEKEVRSKGSGNSKSKSSRKHDGLSEKREEIEEVKRSSRSRLDRDSSRREGEDGGSGRERKGKIGQGEKPRDSSSVLEVADNGRSKKHGVQVGDGEEACWATKKEENTELKVQNGLRKSELENEAEKRTKRRGDGSTGWDKHEEDADITKDGKYKKDERYKYQEALVKDSRHQDDKRRDEEHARDSTRRRSNDKHYRDEKDIEETWHKKSKPRDRDRDYDRDYRPRHDHDREHNHDRNHHLDRALEYYHDHDHDGYRDHSHHEREHERDHDHSRSRGRERDCDRDRGTNLVDQNSGSKDNRRKRSSLDDHSGHNDVKSRGVKAHHHSDLDKSFLQSGEIDSDADKGSSRFHQAHVDTSMSSSQHYHESDYRNNEYRHFSQENLKYEDSAREQGNSPSSAREFSVSGAPDKAPRYRSIDKMDDNPMGELVERSSSSKASPLGLIERSSSTSVDRKNMNRTGIKRNLDFDERGWRNGGSNDIRESTFNGVKLNRDNPLDKSSTLLKSPFRSGVDSPSLRGFVEEDNRVTTNTHNRSGDPNMGRNSWKGVANWSSLSNGFLPFQHGPSPGSFQGMVPHFPSPLFGVRPSLEVNHSGIPYHFPDADRLPSHVRPRGWQNMVDGSSHMDGWDAHGAFRGESHMYGGPQWDQKTRSLADSWKEENGDVNMDTLSTSQKEEYPVKALGSEVSLRSADQRSEGETNNCGFGKHIEMERSSGSSQAEKNSESPNSHEKIPQTSKIPSLDDSQFCVAYLSKLDISVELTRPELYDKCMTLLNLEPSATVDEDITKKLEGDWKARPKFPVSKLKALLVPGAKDSVFKRAMDLYKKQNMEKGGIQVSNGEKVDCVLTSDQEKEKEHVSLSDQEKAEEHVQLCDHEIVEEHVQFPDHEIVEEHALVADKEKVEEHLPHSDQEMVEEHALVSDKEKAEEPNPISDRPETNELVPLSNLEIQEDIVGSAPSLKLEAPVEPQICENPQEPPIFSSENKDQMTSDKIKLLSPDHSTESGPISPLKGSEQQGGNNSSSSAGEQEAIGDPLLVPDESSMSMRGSNESESVIISRMHHSPENTH